jgi:predicted DNA-binding transcriptional regulator AlpA
MMPLKDSDSDWELAHMRRSPKPVTIHDVAEAAGVSVSTVSRVLNDKDTWPQRLTTGCGSWTIEKMAIQGDHVHPFMQVPPQCGPVWVARIAKSISAREAFQSFPQLRDVGGRIPGGWLFRPQCRG